MNIPNDDAFQKWLADHPEVAVVDDGSGRRMTKPQTAGNMPKLDTPAVVGAKAKPITPRLERPALRKGEPVPTEHQEQVALLKALADQTKAHPCLELLYAIPNGGKLPFTRTAGGKIVSKQRILLVAEGMRPGVPDLCLPVARQKTNGSGWFHGLYIEMKRADHSRKATKEQKWWIERLSAGDYKCVVCFGAAEAFDQIMRYIMEID